MTLRRQYQVPEGQRQIGRTHGDIFGAIRRVTAMVQVARLINPEVLVEIEAVAIIGHEGD